jgi:hypothetical protein
MTESANDNSEVETNAKRDIYRFPICHRIRSNPEHQSTTGSKTSGTETASVVRRMVEVYVQSIVDADAKLGATVWSPTPDVSFIEPRGC